MGPSGVRLILALPVFPVKVEGQRMASPMTTRVSSSSLIEQPTLVILPLPTIVNSSGPQCLNI